MMKSTKNIDQNYMLLVALPFQVYRKILILIILS